MTKTERIKAAIDGKRPDMIPYSLWSHFPGVDMDPARLAEHTWEFYKKLNVDFIKTMSNGMYAIEDLGCEIDYSEVAKGGVAKVAHTPVSEVDDWNSVPAAHIGKGALARELASLELLLERLRREGEDVPVVFTVFSPLTTADKLSGKRLLRHIAEGGGGAVHAALDRITESTCALARRAVELGAAGVFLASQMSGYDVMGEALYREYGVPYDLRVLQASGGWFNALHAHGDNILFGVLKDYPVHALNWHVWESPPDPDEGHDLAAKCIMGGIKRMDVTNRNKNAVRSQIYRTVKALDGAGLILTPGCVIRHPLDEEMLAFVRQAKDDVEQALFARSDID